jgi:adenylate cyclase
MHGVVAGAANDWVTSDTNEKLQGIAMAVVDLADGLEEARQQGDKKLEKEALDEMRQKRGYVDNLVMQLPLMESRLRALVRGRFCLVGVTSTSTTDVSATPMQEQYVNIGVHANLIDQGLRGDYLFRPPWARVDLPVLLAYLWLIPLVLPLISIRKGAFALALTVGIHMAIATYLLVYRGIWIDGTTPVLAMLAAFGAITIRRYLMEERQKSRIRSMFQTYLDPRVVEAMLVDESVFTEIGGTTREITAFFSDIAGFTTISELLDSDELSAMLQEYLTPMTERILEHGGLRDKYIGDAIVGIFGAPYPSDDHAAQACLAAIELVEKLAELKREWEAQAVPWYRKVRERGLDLSFRIGLNTGRAKVGNFGSRDAKNYTMIGDTVNLAARLEGANKAYGSRVLISESTYGRASAVIEARELDLLRVVGKLQPVRVFEVLGRRGQVDPSRMLLARRFAEGLFAYRGRKFDEARKLFTELHLTFPDDPATSAYLKRLEDTAYIASLGSDWDGAFISKEK